MGFPGWPTNSVFRLLRDPHVPGVVWRRVHGHLQWSTWGTAGKWRLDWQHWPTTPERAATWIDLTMTPTDEPAWQTCADCRQAMRHLEASDARCRLHA